MGCAYCCSIIPNTSHVFQDEGSKWWYVTHAKDKWLYVRCIHHPSSCSGPESIITQILATLSPCLILLILPLNILLVLVTWIWHLPPYTIRHELWKRSHTWLRLSSSKSSITHPVCLDTWRKTTDADATNDRWPPRTETWITCEKSWNEITHRIQHPFHNSQPLFIIL